MKKTLFTKITAILMTLFISFTNLPVYASSFQDAPEEYTSEFLDETSTSSTEDTTEDNNNPLLRWRTTDHMDKQCDYVATKLNLSSSQKSWIKETCKLADTGSYKKLALLHAKRSANYLAGLRTVFVFARNIGKSNILNDIILTEKMNNLSDKQRENVIALYNAMNSYINSKGSISKEHKQYLLYGFGLHIVGDMFSHRTIVKKITLTDWGKTDTSSIKYFHDRDFNPTKLQSFKSEISNGTLYTAKIRDFMVTNDTSDSSHTYKINYSINGKKTTTNCEQVYTDNPTFMPKRFSAVKDASVSFMTQVRKSGSSFSDINFYLSNYNLELHNYNSYVSEIKHK